MKKLHYNTVLMFTKQPLFHKIIDRLLVAFPIAQENFVYKTRKTQIHVPFDKH